MWVIRFFFKTALPDKIIGWIVCMFICSRDTIVQLLSLSPNSRLEFFILFFIYLLYSCINNEKFMLTFKSLNNPHSTKSWEKNFKYI